MTVPDSSRPLRRDAERNRVRIMDAARVVFADRGLAGSHNDIAHQAEVGVGTVYRRFPEKEQLIDALFQEGMQALVAIAKKALTVDDPWQGLRQFIVESQELQANDRGLMELVIDSDRGKEHAAEARSQIAPLTQQLFDRAQEAGLLRADIVPADLPLMVIGLSAIREASRETAPDVWRRTLTVLLDGLRATTTAQAFTEPPLSLQELDAVNRASVRSRR